MKSGDYETVQKLAIEGKSIDADKYYVSNWYEMLINIYRLTGQTEKLKKELLHYIFELKKDDFAKFKELKELVSQDEWIKIRKRLMESDIRFNRCKFLCEEMLYKELLERIKKEDNSNLFVTYEKELLKNLTIETRDAFLTTLDKEMYRAYDRTQYKDIASKLSQICRKYPDGKVLADELTKKWVVQYKRRSAMLDELRRAGFDV